MRKWCHRHPHVPWAGHAIMTLLSWYWGLKYFDDQRWGWSAFFMVASIGWYLDAKKWWERT